MEGKRIGKAVGHKTTRSEKNLNLVEGKFVNAKIAPQSTLIYFQVNAQGALRKVYNYQKIGWIFLSAFP